MNNKHLFRGAGVIITSDSSNETNDEGDIFVRTKYAYKLSQLLFAFGKCFQNKIDYINKYTFYGSIALEYNFLIQKNGDIEENLYDILFSVGKEAVHLYEY